MRKPVKKLNQPVTPAYVNRGVTERFMAGEYDNAPMGNDIVNFFSNVLSKSAQASQTTTATAPVVPVVKKKNTTTYIMLGIGGIALLGLGILYMKNRKK